MHVTAEHSSESRLREARGFTLIEVMVAMTTGVVVMGALFAILVLSLHQSRRIADSVQATQSGRVALTTMIDELHSACMSASFTPVQSGSSESTLLFRNANSEKAVIDKTEAYEHKLSWASSKLTDFRYPASGGEWPSFTYSSTASPASGTVLASNISQVGGEPIFRYFKYATAAATSSESGTDTLSEIALAKGSTLSATGAHEVAAVQINFNAAPVDNDSRAGRVAQFTTQVLFAFSAPDAEAPITDAPCQ